MKDPADFRLLLNIMHEKSANEMALNALRREFEKAVEKEEQKKDQDEVR